MKLNLLRPCQDLRTGVFAYFVTVILGVTDDVRDKLIVICASDHFAARRTHNLLRHCPTPISPDATSDVRDGTKPLRNAQGA